MRGRGVAPAGGQRAGVTTETPWRPGRVTTAKVTAGTVENRSVMPHDERSFSGRARRETTCSPYHRATSQTGPSRRKAVTNQVHLGSISLWVSTRASTSDPWSAPAYLGPVINYPGNNAGAALSFDGTAIYFQASKTSHPGFGNYALFVATRTKMKAEEK